MKAASKGGNVPHSVSVGSKAPQESTVELQLDHHQVHGQLSWGAFLLLSWTCIGVIFGDICTSPLYVYSSIFAELTPSSIPSREDILGVVSLIFYTLTLEVLVKYMGVVLRADDQGQGGTFALYSLLCRHIGIKPHGVRGPAAAAPMSKGLIAAAARAASTTSRLGLGSSRREASRGGAIKTLTASTTASAAATVITTGLPGEAVTAGVVAGCDPGDGDLQSDSDSDDDGEEGYGGGGAPKPEPQLWWQRYAMDKERVRGFFRRSRTAQVMLWCVSVTATAMLIGDGVLTPSMSVLSAVSGLSVAVPTLGQDVIIGVTIAILVLVFAAQQLGTGVVGRFFAPIIALWLVANAAINAYNLAEYGGYVFNALNPAHIVTLFANHGSDAWRSLGAIMLSVTGAEALFADLGHFSRGSISVAFGFLAYPCLVVTYFGQAAFLIKHPADIDVFWKSLPSKLLYPMLVLATFATVVASQALISGVFSIVRQAMILGAFPPVKVVHTGGNDPAAATQVYVPLANFVLFVLCCAVVAGFQSTVALGKAYGLAVMTDMMTTTCLVTLVMVTVWGTSLFLVVPFFVLFAVVEGAYWSANIIKVPEGGWFTLAVAFCVSVIMFTWWAGSRRLGERLAALTAGAQIRVLGAPQPPPLLAQAPLLGPPPPPSSAAASHASPYPSLPPPPDMPFSMRILSRISSLMTSQGSKQQSSIAAGASPSTTAAAGPGGDLDSLPSTPAAALKSPAPAAAAAPVRDSSLKPRVQQDGAGALISATSAPLPLPKLESRSAFATVQVANQGANSNNNTGLPQLPSLEVKSSFVGGHGHASGHPSGKLPQAGSHGGGGGGGGGGPGRRGGGLGLFSKSRLQPTRSQGGPYGPQHQQQQQQQQPGTPRAVQSPAPPSRSGLSVLRRRYRPVPEAAFTPGTLALVLPPEAEMNKQAAAKRRAGRNAAAAATAAAAAGTVVEADPELGGVAAAAAAAVADAADAQAAAASGQPLIVPLGTRLAGIGVYYMDEKIGATSDTSGSLPPVLVHFLGNVQAIHEVCVFLSVRRYPIPTVPRNHRLHVYAPHAATPPNFYQAVARYGYLDIIDHGPAFMSELLDAVLRRLATAAYRAAYGNPAGRGGAFPPGGPVPEDAATAEGGGGEPPSANTAAHQHHQQLYQQLLAQQQEGKAVGRLSRLGQHSVSVMLRLAASSRSHHGGAAAAAAAGALSPATALVSPAAAALPAYGSQDVAVAGAAAVADDTSVYKDGHGSGAAAAAAAAGADELPEGGVLGGDSDYAAASGRGGGVGGGAGQASGATRAAAAAAAAAAARYSVEDTLAAFLEAQLHGVVYYASRSLVRPDPRANAWPLTRLVHWFLYGILYGFLVSISYDDMERWNVPGENLVQLGMHVEI